MSERTLTTGLIVGIVAVALVAGPALGASVHAGDASVERPADASPVPLAQDDGNETAQNETTQNQTTTAANETEQLDDETNETVENETEQQVLGNETPGIRNVSVRKLTIERLSLQGVTVRNTMIEEVVLRQAALQENATNATNAMNATNATDLGIANASIDRVAAVNVTMTDVVLRNFTVYNDSLARELFAQVVTGNDSANATQDVPQNVSLASYRIDSVTLRDRTINGLFVRRAVVQSASLQNRTEVEAALADDYATVADLPDRGNAPPEATIVDEGELGFYNPSTQDPDYAVGIGQAIIGNVTKVRLAAVGPEAAGPAPAANETTTAANETTVTNETTTEADATTTQANETTAADETTVTNETTAANETTTQVDQTTAQTDGMTATNETTTQADETTAAVNETTAQTNETIAQTNETTTASDAEQ